MRLDAPIHQPQGVLGFTHRRKRTPFVFGVIVMAMLVGILVAVFGLTLVIPQGRVGAPTVSLEIPPEMNDAIVALRDAGVLRYPRSLRTFLQLRSRAIRPGRYTISPHLSVWSLARLLTTTRPRLERDIRILEGWNLRDIAAYLVREGIIGSPEALFAVTGAPAVDDRSTPAELPRPRDFTAEFPLLAEKPTFIGLEGYLFPETYRIYADASAEDLVRKMLAHLDRTLTFALREEIVRSGRTLHQILTMASIIEAEIAVPADRPIAAGILWKRRDRGMLLQVDATVNYVTGKHDPRVSREDTVVDSAYNTYRYPGLPRGPIGNPGMDAILAALRPQPSPYWFFLTTRDRRTVFSRTLDEHHVNIAQHLR